MTPSQTSAQPGPFVTTAVLMMAATTIMANATIAPSLPGLKAHFADVPGIETLSGLLLTLPSLAILLTAGLWGWLADRFDRQRMLIGAGVLYAVGGTSGLWAGSLEMMLAGRALLGLGVAGTMTLAMTWGADLWQGPARARFMGQQGAAMSVGGIVVIVLGGALATLHWRGAFAVYLLVLPVVALAWVALAPYARARTVAPAAVAGPADGSFPWRAFALVGPLAFFFMAVFYVIPTRLPFLLTELGVANPLAIGLIMATMTIFSVPGSLAYGRIRARFSAIAVFGFSFAMMGLGLLVIAQAGSAWGVAAGTILTGIGMGPAMPNYTTYLMSVVPPALRGRASGMLTTAFFAGQFASPLISAPLVGWFGLPGAFAALAGVLAVIAAGLAVWALRVRTVPVAAR